MKLTFLTILAAYLMMATNAGVTINDEADLCEFMKTGDSDAIDELIASAPAGTLDGVMCDGHSVAESGRNLRDERNLGTERVGVGSRCNYSTGRRWWKTTYKCHGHLECKNKRCAEKAKPFPSSYNQDEAGYAGDLAEWVYSDAGGRASLPSSFGTKLGGGERFAVVKKDSECWLVHRATMDNDEIMDDLESQFRISQQKSTRGKPIYINPAFWESYGRFANHQRSVLSQYRSSCGNKFNVVGHSLGGATSDMAIVDMTNNGYRIGDVFNFGSPRPFSDYTVTTWWGVVGDDRSQTCSNFLELIDGQYTRFVRHAYGEDHDPVTAIPLLWVNCADKSVALKSSNVNGHNPCVQENVSHDYPNDSLSSADDLAQWVGTLAFNAPVSWHSISVYKSIARSARIC